ncbi:MAG: hypothetical protein Q8Q28_15265 [Pseudomonadota bacterium]|nr:hypothetical protein [Pseudomonadota bacterium]
MTRIHTLPLDRVMPGMVLGADLCDAYGATLLAAGSELSATQIASLRRRDVRQVVIEVREIVSEAEREARRDEIRARLRHLFRRTGEGEADRVLYQTLLEYRLEQVG